MWVLCGFVCLYVCMRGVKVCVCVRVLVEKSQVTFERRKHLGIRDLKGTGGEEEGEGKVRRGKEREAGGWRGKARKRGKRGRVSREEKRKRGNWRKKRNKRKRRKREETRGRKVEPDCK